ncbi:hypothetical protein SEND513_73 [Mycobacterium phage Send513]|uniref:Uncharacterized protein n=3 Tax=Papyrusvirus send513 TaxID=1982556 RepID=G1BRQ1_9CAUD|nr:hypothetical protein FDI62_gp73 [Mycobacterium phage Send513]AEK07517.1 hypothetical protein SEND513_73 [Mycobacterium phage Send513]ARW57160.1 hypothetical protein SEA_ZENON_75 [Mycobacterium phage Zenon]QCG78178.1 hypothetical protein SEA_CANDLE_71 [Mycobacterium phage Candle]
MDVERVDAHEELVEKVKRLLRRRGWDILVIARLGGWVEAVDFFAFKPDRGVAGIICHVKEGQDYCLRAAQAERCVDWDSPAYVVYSNGATIPAKDLAAHGRKEQYAGHHPFYRYIRTNRVYTFNEVFR